MLNQTIDTEFIILENIYDCASRNTPLRQRDLSQMAGASLGMTNSILKRLAQKGWITIKRLNSRNIQYAVTLEGFNEIVHRSYGYFKRTIKNTMYYKDSLEEIVHRARANNIGSVVLVGSSDLDFIVEHACLRWGVPFRKSADIPQNAEISGAFLIFSENISETARHEDRNNTFYLSRLLVKQAAGSHL
jgi:DNA-binding MarR family transcriptional regulator